MTNNFISLDMQKHVILGVVKSQTSSDLIRGAVKHRLASSLTYLKIAFAIFLTVSYRTPADQQPYTCGQAKKCSAFFLTLSYRTPADQQPYTLYYFPFLMYTIIWVKYFYLWGKYGYKSVRQNRKSIKI